MLVKNRSIVSKSISGIFNNSIKEFFEIIFRHPFFNKFLFALSH